MAGECRCEGGCQPGAGVRVSVGLRHVRAGVRVSVGRRRALFASQPGAGRSWQWSGLKFPEQFTGWESQYRVC